MKEARVYVPGRNSLPGHIRISKTTQTLSTALQTVLFHDREPMPTVKLILTRSLSSVFHLNLRAI